MKATAIILARGGSKGLPGKNTATVGGRPCIAWTIEAAMSDPHFNPLREEVWALLHAQHTP